jgi:hypothetical protein
MFLRKIICSKHIPYFSQHNIFIRVFSINKKKNVNQATFYIIKYLYFVNNYVHFKVNKKKHGMISNFKGFS